MTPPDPVPTPPDRDSVRMIRDVPLQEGDWAVECSNPGHFLKVHPSEFGKLASHPAYSYFRAKEPDPQPAGLPVLPEYQCDHCQQVFALPDHHLVIDGKPVCPSCWPQVESARLHALSAATPIPAPACPDAAAGPEAKLCKWLRTTNPCGQSYQHDAAAMIERLAAQTAAQAAEIAGLRKEQGRLIADIADHRKSLSSLIAERVKDADALTAARDEVERARKEALRIADDFHPSNASEEGLALQEMREAIAALAAALTPNPAQGLKD